MLDVKSSCLRSSPVNNDFAKETMLKGRLAAH